MDSIQAPPLRLFGNQFTHPMDPTSGLPEHITYIQQPAPKSVGDAISHSTDVVMSPIISPLNSTGGSGITSIAGSIASTIRRAD